MIVACHLTLDKGIISPELLMNCSEHQPTDHPPHSPFPEALT